MNKRVVSVFLLVLVLASLLINVGFVSAGIVKVTEDGKTKYLDEATGKIYGSDPRAELGEELGQIGKTLEPILIFLFNIPAKSQGADIAQTLFSFVIAFIIVFTFVLIAFKNLPFFDENRGLSYFIVVVAALLGIRGIAQINPGIMNDIFLPYSALALSIINGAAIVGWFMLVNVGMKGGSFVFIRRFLWILFAVTFIGLWGMRTIWTPEGVEKLTSLTQWIYFGTAGLSIGMAVLDGSIQGFFAKIEADKERHLSKIAEKAKLNAQIKDYRKQVMEGTLSQNDYKELKKKIKRIAKSLGIKRKKLLEKY